MFVLLSQIGFGLSYKKYEIISKKIEVYNFIWFSAAGCHRSSWVVQGDNYFVSHDFKWIDFCQFGTNCRFELPVTSASRIWKNFKKILKIDHFLWLLVVMATPTTSQLRKVVGNERKWLKTIQHDAITHRASWAMTETVISARLLLVVLGCPGLCSGKNNFFLSGV